MGLVRSIITQTVARFTSGFWSSLFGAAGKELGESMRSGPRLRFEAGVARAPVEPAEVRQGRELASGLAELRQRDPRFSEEKFKDQASTVLLRVLEALTKKDLAAVQGLVTPGLLERLGRLIAELAEKKWRRHIAHSQIQRLTITGVKRDGPYFQLTVAVTGRAVDYTAEEATDRLIAGERQEREYAFDLTFLRPETVQTAADNQQPTAANCPNCGAPLKLTALGRCDYCDSVIVSGEFSWTLSEFSSRT